MLSTLSSCSQLGVADWHITETADTIANKRRQGWSDAQITTWLLSKENQDSSKACPWGCNESLVAAAFGYLATGKLPPGTTTTTAPAKPPSTQSSRPWLKPVLIGGGVLAVLGITIAIVKR